MRSVHVPLVAVIVSALALGACASIRASSHVERGLDFTRFRTYDWGPRDALPTSDSRLDRDTFFVDHLEGAIERHMARRGYRRAAQDHGADLLVHYHANIDRRLSVVDKRRNSDECRTDECREGIPEYDAGTLIVDVIDARTNQLVWRGWVQDRFGDFLRDRDRLERALEDGVEDMIRRLPANR